jgi:flagellar biosynthesis protein FlhF
MKLRVFRAPRMAEAMAQARAALGEEAVILGSRRIAGGVEVTAAAEPPAVPPPAPAPSSLTLRPATAAPVRPAVDGLGRHNLPPSLRTALANTAATGLAERLAGLLRFGTLPPGTPRPLLLAGPPGAGKTLSCAKLGARLLFAGTPPLVICADHARAGAAAQIAAYTQVMGLTLVLADTPEALARACRQAAPGQPVLIDSESCDPFDLDQARTLLGLVRAAGAELVLVLPAGLDPAEAAELARGFALLGARHLLPTRLDQARRLGGVLAAAEAAGMILSDAGTGPGAVEGLTPLTAGWLAARLLGGGQSSSAAA